ncbi:MAG: leucine Rich Repeat (LRR)-containing protein [Opitutae bacterium]|nr:leucine Rich Repeat (LRR)-containing protein [Opitutae bacterium]
MAMWHGGKAKLVTFGFSFSRRLRGLTPKRSSFGSPFVMSCQVLRSFAVPLLIGLCLPCAWADLFPDKNLEAAVRRHVPAKKNGKEPLTAADVSRVSEVKVEGKAIKNLKGLEACRELASLELPNNEIEDLSPLAGLERLQLLDLSGNRVRDLGPVSTLKGLQYLNLEHNQLQNLGPLANLPNLRSLYLTDNRISNLAPLRKLTKLWSLYLGNNRLQDISSLKPLKGVVTLGLEGNRIEDISPLGEMGQLSKLFLQNNRIEDLSPLLDAIKKDVAGPRRFGPFLQIWLKGNPVSPDDPQVKELSKLARKVDFDYQ